MSRTPTDGGIDSSDLNDQVATANRLLYMEGQATYSGHVSALADDGETVHINSRDASRGEIRPEQVVRVDLDGEPLDDEAPPPPAERPIHLALYRARDDVGAVMHVHPPHATLFGITGTDLVPVQIRGSILTDGPVPVYDRAHLLTERAHGEAMVEAMDGQNQVLLKGHGAVVCDTSVKRAFARAIYLEMNAYYQHAASSLGNPNQLTPEEVAETHAQNWEPDHVMGKFWRFFTWQARANGYLPEEW